MRLPLIEDKPLVKETSLDMAYGYSKYDVGYTTNTCKSGLGYSATASLRFRGGYNRASTTAGPAATRTRSRRSPIPTPSASWRAAPASGTPAAAPRSMPGAHAERCGNATGNGRA